MVRYSILTPTRVLVDASNLHVGGGVQVAASFLGEIASLVGAGRAPSWLEEATIEASTEVFENLPSEATALLKIRVADSRPWSIRKWIPRDKHDVAFTVFGPEYGFKRGKRRVVGYADVTSIYPNPLGVKLGIQVRIKRAFRRVLSRASLRSADLVVVETRAFADAVEREFSNLRATVHVVPNCVNAVVVEAGRLPMAYSESAPPRLLYVARAYPHKNHDFLGQVGSTLANMGTRVQFLVTLTTAEWESRTDLFREFAVNLGPLPVERVVDAHRQADAVIFPSLLEAFSATPIEALALGRLVFASDRDFVRSVCADAPVYFDPLEPASAAKEIRAWLTDRSSVESQAADAAERVLEGLWRPEKRALRYSDLIEAELHTSIGETR